MGGWCLMFTTAVYCDGIKCDLHFQLNILDLYEISDRHGGNLTGFIQQLVHGANIAESIEFIDELILTSYCEPITVSAPNYTQDTTSGFVKRDVHGKPLYFNLLRTPAYNIFRNRIYNNPLIAGNFIKGIMEGMEEME